MRRLRHVSLVVVAVAIAAGAAACTSTSPTLATAPPPSAAPPPSVPDAAPCQALPVGLPPPILRDLDGILVGFLDGSCSNDPACHARWIEGERSTWEARLREPEKKSFPFANGEFGTPGGGNRIRGPAWQFYFVFPTPPPESARGPFTTDVDGVAAYTGRGWVDDFGAFLVEAMLFADQLPGTAQRMITLRSCDGRTVLQRRVELVAKQPF